MVARLNPCFMILKGTTCRGLEVAFVYEFHLPLLFPLLKFLLDKAGKTGVIQYRLIDFFFISLTLIHAIL